MTELIEKLKSDAGLTEEQANLSLGVIKQFVKDKFPMLAGAVDNVFGVQHENEAAFMATEAVEAMDEKSSWLDKISDIIPGEMGEKIEEIAKKAAEKAGDAFDKAKDVATDAFDKAKDVAAEAYDKARDTTEDLVEKAKDKFENKEKQV